MGIDDHDIWFRLGYALERARTAPRKVPAFGRLRQLGWGLEGATSSGRSKRRRNARRQGSESGSELPMEQLLGIAVRVLGARLLTAVPLRKRTGILGLLSSAVSGSAAAVVAELVGLLTRFDKRVTLDRDELALLLLAGAGRGLTYGAVLEPRIPGPILLSGVLFGTAEYLTASLGGVSTLLGSSAPHRRFPLLADAVDRRPNEDGAFLEHLTFGLALALVYGSLRPNRGTTDEDDEAA